MKTVDGDKLIEILKKNPDMTAQQMMCCIDVQDEVVSVQKALIKIWNEMDYLCEPEDTERLSGLRTAKDALESSIGTEYFKDFVLEKPSLKRGDKIYYIDYEESGNSYTVTGLSVLPRNELFKGGVAYAIHADDLPFATGHYTVLLDEIDQGDGRFFSTPEKAREAYIAFRQKNEKDYE